MSFTVTPDRPLKANRSELAVPASRPEFFEKAAHSAADVIFLDLEDAVAHSEKDKARQNAIEAINDINWGNKLLSVRINGLDTPYMYRDVIDILENTRERLDLIMIPKVGTASDVYALDMLVSQVEQAMGRKNQLGFEIIIETALGMTNIHEIAPASTRIESLHFGVGDYSASIKARTTKIGGADPAYAVLTDPDESGKRQRHWGDMWNYAVCRLVSAARANGLRAIDGPFTDFPDLEGYESVARGAGILGCEGKWAIHPTQIAPANAVFSPTDAEIVDARAILKAMDKATEEGTAAVVYKGRLIDLASIKQAQLLTEFADAAQRSQ